MNATLKEEDAAQNIVTHHGAPARFQRYEYKKIQNPITRSSFHPLLFLKHNPLFSRSARGRVLRPKCAARSYIEGHFQQPLVES